MVGKVVDLSWLTADLVSQLHDEIIADSGGSPGIRDPGGLQAALARPANIQAYKETDDPVALASALSCSIVARHPFVDGNKRTAFACLMMFLGMYGLRLTMSETNAYELFVGLAEGSAAEDDVVEAVRWAIDDKTL